MKQKLILTDIDGVTVNWSDAFNDFMNYKGHHMVSDVYDIKERYHIDSDPTELIIEFNNSEFIETLHPYLDSVEYVKKFSDAGYRFIAITSLSDNPIAISRREKNLTNIFGNVFEDIICLPYATIKYDTLCNWKDSGLFWLDDHEVQTEAGYKAGLTPLLFRHSYNTSFHTTDYKIVDTWKDVYKIILD